MTSGISTLSTREGLKKYRELTDSEIDTAIKSGVLQPVPMGKIDALHFDSQEFDDWCYALHLKKIEAANAR